MCIVNKLFMTYSDIFGISRDRIQVLMVCKTTGKMSL